jgi:hypothetical protein
MLARDLKERYGLHVNADALEQHGATGSAEDVFAQFQDLNLKAFAEPCLPENMKSIDRIHGLICLQVSGARNMSAPMLKQEGGARRMLGIAQI